MDTKIQWYKEVLTLEPNSKLFFALAELLVKDGQIHEAMQVLESGLARHEEYLEARLFYIELLYQVNEHEKMAAQVQKLENMFSRYKGFWHAWASFLATNNSFDASSIVRFIALYFSNNKISLQEVLNRGLDSLINESYGHVSIPYATKHRADENPSLKDAEKEEPSVQEQEDTQKNFVWPKEENEDLHFSHGISDAELQDSSPISPTSPLKALKGLNIERHESLGNPKDVSLRTRSMADILADQGDIKGALDIYTELESATKNEEEIHEIRERMSTLKTQLNADTVVETQAPQNNARVINLLEALSQRLDSRANV
ncbi:MAG: tetratricopeptide repeat protein [Desulfovibrio sp.]|nr:tetratricopeptide repeat protein [Desulfovibrio sp.]